uniref:Disrupted in renal carcinoma protein 2 n=1 Tax=Schizaphis graminum TaxID=13262 RepID=A0A2S2PME8_SCHGA
MTCASMAGAAAGLLVTTVLRQGQPYPQQAVISEVNMRTNEIIILYISFVANIVCLLFAYFVFPREPRKRKHCDQSPGTKQKCDISSTSFLLQTVFKSIQNSDLVYVALSYACSNALSWPWYQMIDITYSKVGFPQTVSNDCRLWMIIHTCVLSLSVCWLADRIAGSSNRLGILCHCLAAIFMLWVVLALCIKSLRRRTNFLVFGVMFAFPLSWTTQSLLYELAADYAHPLPESMAVGLICLLETLCENCMYFILYAVPKFHLYWLHVFTFIAGLLSVIFIILIKGKKFDRYYN